MNGGGRHVTLLTREGCHLCEQARRTVREAAAATGAGWSETDVDTDPETRAEYGDRVPVVLVDGVEHGHFRVDLDALLAALR
ncbi:glutaredoxin family protein [Nakamurella lactea]|uniref:glutaredoxin family protein n=1 Tax=Nakamurella lactea TaxID=459515 RepID=UPI000490514D|nr:glutaredoxin family protein [Nakamurella lactea]